MSAAITNHRALGPAEAKVMAVGGVLLFAVSLLAVVYPLVVTFPLAMLGSWVSATLMIRAMRLWSGKPPPPTDDRVGDMDGHVDRTSSSGGLQADAALTSVRANDQDRQLESPASDRSHA